MSELYYASQELEDAMARRIALHRYAPLARKALSHYLGDLYDPKSYPAQEEYDLRFYISVWVELKVFDKEPYDWPVIDNFFKFYLNEVSGFKHIQYEERLLEIGYNGVMRGELPTYHA